MAEPHPLALRKRAVDAYERGEGSYATVGDRFFVGEASVKRWVRQYRREGHLMPQRKGGGTKSDISLEELEAIIERLGDATAGEITAEYNRGRRGRQRRHVSSVKRALHRGGYVVKKNASVRWSNSGRTSSKNVQPSSNRSGKSR
jgi:transposase